MCNINISMFGWTPYMTSDSTPMVTFKKFIDVKRANHKKWIRPTCCLCFMTNLIRWIGIHDHAVLHQQYCIFTQNLSENDRVIYSHSFSAVVAAKQMEIHAYRLENYCNEWKIKDKCSNNNTKKIVDIGTAVLWLAGSCVLDYCPQ